MSPNLITVANANTPAIENAIRAVQM